MSHFDNIKEVFVMLELGGQLDAYEEWGLGVTHDGHTLHIHDNDKAFAKVGVDWDILLHVHDTLAEGGLDAPIVKVIAHRFEEAFEEVQQKIASGVQIEPVPAGEPTQPVSIPEEIAGEEWPDPSPVSPGGLPGAAAQGAMEMNTQLMPPLHLGTTLMLAPDEMELTAPMNLNAVGTGTRLLQPVQATSEGSRYFLVGVSEGVAMAMRWRQGKLSVRVEGKRLKDPTFAANLKAVGFTHVGKNYASVHLDLPQDSGVLARKTCGAFLASVCSTWHTRQPDIQLINGKGK